MNPDLKKLPHHNKSLVSLETIIIAATVWGAIALVFYLLFSVPVVVGADEVARRPNWFIVTTYVFELVAYLGAAILCFRNWLSSNIFSGRNVWLGIGFGMLSYFLGNLILCWWELVLHQQGNVSPADLFFIGTYLFLGLGMIVAVMSRRLYLDAKQWAIVAAIALVGILLAIWVYSSGNLQTPASGFSWVSIVQKSVNLFYIVVDVLLLIIATMLLLAFWGGRFAQSWRAIAAAVFSLYIADMWLQYVENHIANYQSGGLLEVFSVFSGVLFAIGAALEYEISSRSRRISKSRRA